MLLLQAGGVGGFWDIYGEDLLALLKIGGGILVYGLIVNAFYQIISKRVMFGKKDAGGRIHVGGPGRGFVYLLFFPLISLAFFLLLSGALLFFQGTSGSENLRTPIQVFTLAMGIVLAVRVAAYFSEPTSHDVAKMLPLGLLGVFLATQNEFGTLLESVRSIARIFDHLDVIAIYFGVVVLAEYILRIVYLSVKASKGAKVHRPGGPKPPSQMRTGGYQPPVSGHNQPPQFKR